jgi:hypothetical protein
MAAGDSITYSKNKRDRSVFDAVSFLDSQDAQAEKRKRRQTKDDELRRTAASSQTKLFGSLMESRILLQRAMQHEDNTSGAAVEKCNDLLARLLTARQLLAEKSQLSDEIDYRQLVGTDDSVALQSILQKEYESLRHVWKDVLNRRHKDVRLHTGLTAKAQFRAIDSSFWQQVDATVQHEKLRTFDEERPSKFDDAKVYQHLLQDFVRSANRSDAQLAEDRLEQAKHKVTNKLVDRKASKGRKIRYQEIPKLLNFTFPLSRPQTQSVLDEKEWFSSLFGGAGMKK